MAAMRVLALLSITVALVAGSSPLAAQGDQLAQRRLASAEPARPMEALCAQQARSIDESRALAGAIAARVSARAGRVGSYDVRELVSSEQEHAGGFQPIGALAVVLVRDTTTGATLLHELTHAAVARRTPAFARAEIERVLSADSAGQLPAELVSAALRSFTLGFSRLADPRVAPIVGALYRNALTQRGASTPAPGRLADALRASDPFALNARGVGGGDATAHPIASVFDRIADEHWRFAGLPRPRDWDWRTERAFILVSEVLAYESELRCRAADPAPQDLESRIALSRR
jgi:hypothetical protein